MWRDREKRIWYWNKDYVTSKILYNRWNIFNKNWHLLMNIVKINWYWHNKKLNIYKMYSLGNIPNKFQIWNIWSCYKHIRVKGYLLGKKKGLAIPKEIELIAIIVIRASLLKIVIGEHLKLIPCMPPSDNSPLEIDSSYKLENKSKKLLIFYLTSCKWQSVI